MPMMLLIETDGGISEFVMKPIDRKSCQRVSKRLAVDYQGRECSRALMTHDGLLLGSGSVSDLYEDCDGNGVEHGEVVAILPSFSRLIPKPSRRSQIACPNASS